MQPRALSPLFATLATLAVLSCSAPPPEYEVVPEPASALRPAEESGVVPPEARIADYVLDARLDGEKHQVQGSAQVTWRNKTSRSVDTLPFHLYMNGFRAEDTAWMQGSGGRHRGNRRGRETPWGYIDVHSVRMEEESGLQVADTVEDARETVELEFAEDAEPSTMTVRLPRSVGPGETITVSLDFTTQLPEVYARTGYKDDFHAVGQWFPKVGVLEEDGWNVHTFHYHDEFYADFGNYTVFLDVPEEMVVGATGIRTSEEVVEGRKQLTYEAEMVHDFAFFADPDFVESWAEYDGIRIRQLMQPERAGDAQAHFDAQIAAFESYEKRYGKYPWSTLTIVHVPDDAGGAGGMEYPTLFTTSDRAPIPQWVRDNVFDERGSGVFTTIHEFGHQYFQGLFASREHAEPWLDEGVNTFSNQLALRDWLGEDAWLVDLLGQRITVNDMARLSRGNRAYLQPASDPASAFGRARANYGSTIYQRTAVFLLTLRNLVGHDAFDRAFALYCERARFAHPRGEDLVNTLVEELGTPRLSPGDDGEPIVLDVAHFLDQALHTTRRVDFAVYQVRNDDRLGDDGWHRGDDGVLARNDLEEEGEDEDEKKEEEEKERQEGKDPEESVATVVVERVGAFEVPVEVLVEFTDDSTETRVWDGVPSGGSQGGKYSATTVVWTWSGKRVRRVRVDPDVKLLMESRRLDNLAWAPDEEEDDGLSKNLGNLGEAFVLALLGGLAP